MNLNSMLKQFHIALFLLIHILSLSCREKKQSIFAPGTPFSLVLSILAGLQSKPIFSPAPGVFTQPITVRISNSEKNNGIPIHFTTDGSRATCLSQRYDSSTGVFIEFGKVKLQAVECFQGFPSKIETAEYSITANYNYGQEADEGLIFVIGNSYTFNQIGLKGNFTYLVTPKLPDCITLNSENGNLTGNCLVTYPTVSYKFTATRTDGSKEDYFHTTNISVGQWLNEAYLKAPNAEASDKFGNSVSISGDTIVVGAFQEASNQTIITNGTTSAGNGANFSGAAYVFRRTGTTWTNEAYLKAPNNEASDQFGYTVSISGDTIVVSASGEDSNQSTITNGTLASGNNSLNFAGAAYVFRRNGNIWTSEAYLKPPNPSSIDTFGVPLEISGDTIVVSASQEDSNQTTITNGTTITIDDSSSNSGAAYVFKRTGNFWTHEAYLKAPNSEASDLFGSSVSISGDTIVVGSVQEDSNQTTITNGTTNAGNGASNSGAAYVFRRTGNIWLNEAYLKAPNAESADQFGWSVSISGDRILVGANSESSNQSTITNGTTNAGNGASQSGAVYVFRRTGTTWTNEAYLKAPNPDNIDLFGNSISISGSVAVISATLEASNQTTITNGPTASANNSSAGSGAAYVFRRRGTTWVNEAYLKAPNAEAGDEFGNSVSISGDTIVVGTQNEDSNQTTITNGTLTSSNNSATDSGAVYVYRLR